MCRNIKTLANLGILAEFTDGRQYLIMNNTPWSRRQFLGTAGAFKNLESRWTDTTLVVYGDNLMRFDLAAFETNHRASKAAATVALFDPSAHANTKIAGGLVALDDRGWVRSWAEGKASPGARYVNAGAYLLEPSVSQSIGSGYRDFGAEVLPAQTARGTLRGHVLEPSGYCLGLDTPESYHIAEELISRGQVVLQ